MSTTTLLRRSSMSIALGFAVLFAIYHFHEFFQSLTVSGITLLTFMLASHVVARAQQLEGIKSWGLALTHQWWLKLLIGLILGAGFVCLSTAVSVYLGYEQLTENPGIGVFLQKIWWIMFMTFWPSLAEDILTRGYLYRHLGQRMQPNWWIIFSAAVYVLNHIWRLTDHPSVLTYLFILGLALAAAMQLTQSLWLTLGIHWASNIVYYVTVDIYPTASLVNGHQSTWVLAAAYAVLLVLLVSALALRRKSRTLGNSLPNFA